MSTICDVAINGRFLTRPVSGVERVAVQLIRSLDDMATEGGIVQVPGRQLRFCVVTPDAAAAAEHGPLFRHIPVVRTQGKVASRLHGHAWEQLVLPWATSGKYLLSLANACPALRGQQSVYIHDAAIYAVPQAYSWKYRGFYKALYLALHLSEPRILTNSEFSKGEIARYLGFAQDSIDVIVPGADGFRQSSRDDALLLRHGLERRNFLLAVSSAQSNKNFDGIVKALEILGDQAPQVAIVGSMTHASFKQSATGTHAKVKHLGRVSDAELAALYEATRGLIYPSFYEGFGLPPVEAIVSGTLPIVSRRASLPEVCGASVLYCEPDDVKSIAQAITRLCGMSSEEWQERQTLSQAHVARFRWSHGAQQLLSHLQQVFSSEEH